MDTKEQLRQKGQALVEELKTHVLTVLSKDPRGAPNGVGLGNSEIEQLAGLEIPLDRPKERKQEHWLTWTIVQRLLADQKVESTLARRNRYRLRNKTSPKM